MWSNTGHAGSRHQVTDGCVILLCWSCDCVLSDGSVRCLRSSRACCNSAELHASSACCVKEATAEKRPTFPASSRRRKCPTQWWSRTTPFSSSASFPKTRTNSCRWTKRQFWSEVVWLVCQQPTRCWRTAVVWFCLTSRSSSPALSTEVLQTAEPRGHQRHRQTFVFRSCGRENPRERFPFFFGEGRQWKLKHYATMCVRTSRSRWRAANQTNSISMTNMDNAYVWQRG